MYRCRHEDAHVSCVLCVGEQQEMAEGEDAEAEGEDAEGDADMPMPGPGLAGMLSVHPPEVLLNPLSTTKPYKP